MDVTWAVPLVPESMGYSTFCGGYLEVAASSVLSHDQLVDGRKQLAIGLYCPDNVASKHAEPHSQSNRCKEQLSATTVRCEPEETYPAR